MYRGDSFIESPRNRVTVKEKKVRVAEEGCGCTVGRTLRGGALTTLFNIYVHTLFASALPVRDNDALCLYLHDVVSMF